MQADACENQTPDPKMKTPVYSAVWSNKQGESWIVEAAFDSSKANQMANVVRRARKSKSKTATAAGGALVILIKEITP